MSAPSDPTRPSETEVRPDSAPAAEKGNPSAETSTPESLPTGQEETTSSPTPEALAEPVEDAGPDGTAAPAPEPEAVEPVPEQIEPTIESVAEDASTPEPATEEAVTTDEAPPAEAAPEETVEPEAVTEVGVAPEPIAATEPAAETEADESPAVAEEIVGESAAPETASDAEPAPEPAAEADADEPPAVSPGIVSEAATPETIADAGSGAKPAEADEAAPAEPEAPIDPALLSPRQRRILELKGAMDEKAPVEGVVIGWNQGGFHISIDGVGAFCPSSLMELGQTKDPATYLDKPFEFRVIKHQKQGRRIVLSRVPVLREQRRRQLGELRSQLEVGATLAGKVTSLTNFGAFVDLGGLEGLVHVSEISHQRVTNPSQLLQVGQEVQVKVLRIEKKGKRISLSMKALEADPWSAVADRFAVGTKFEGKVLRHAEFGIFVELEPGVEGLLHTSQLRPGMDLADPALQVGAQLEGWIRVCEPSRQRLSLSLREVAQGDPWTDIEKRYPDGKLVGGRVEQVAPFGAFILLEPGLTGLLPQSEMRVPKGADPRRHYALGQEIQVQVVEIDRGRRRLTLALEGARVEGSKADVEAFKKQQRGGDTNESLGTLAAAFERARKK